MNPTEWLQMIGTVAIAGLAGLLLYTASRPLLWRQSGRAANAIIAVYLGSAVGVRLLAQFQVLSQTEARIANGFGALLFLAVLVYVLLGGRKDAL